MNWKPTLSQDTLIARAKILRKIREFFFEKNVLEVETPLMSNATVTDLHLHSFNVKQVCGKYNCYLQTSPEYAMKRLLAFGSGSIYQICKAFRDDEAGRFHNPEFTLLEWYRIGFDHHALMNEMNELLTLILQCENADRITYQDLFQQYLNIDPLTTSLDDLKKMVSIDFQDINDKDTLLQILMSESIEPHIGQERPLFIYDYPATQAALAKINAQDKRVAERFEVYFKGIELANGFHELTNAKEQRNRFMHDLEKRKEQGLNQPPMDENLLAALEHGMPHCAGVALGVDRLIMLALRKTHIHDVMTFPIDRA